MTSFWDGLPRVDQDLRRVRAIAFEAVADARPYIRDNIHELLNRPGKMLRPAFTLLGARIAGESAERGFREPGAGARSEELPDKLYFIAAAVELLHLATLIHDDVIDEAETRRGGPALHRKVGAHEAILMGDYLLSSCFSLVSDHASMDNARYLSTAVRHIVQGEIAQAEQNRLGEVSVREYVHRIIGKTALLFSLSLHIGASEIEGNPRLQMHRLQMHLRRSGYSTGMAFQIIDDILDLAGDPTRIGKQTGNDLRQGNLTLPVVLASRSISRNERLDAKLSAVSRGTAAVAEVAEEVERLGGLQSAREMAAAYTRRALGELRSIQPTPALEDLQETIRRLLDRDY